MSLLGVIGGMGVKATGRFYEMLTEMQPVSTEQEYLDVLIYSKPSIPDRTAYITGQSQVNPLESLLRSAKVLEEAGATCIAMPCVTAHFFYEPLAQGLGVPVLNMLEATAQYSVSRGYSKVGLLATDGTIHGGLFHKALADIETIVPDAKGQQAIMDLIYAIKCGKAIDIDASLDTAAASLYAEGAQAVILGCTELSLPRKAQGGPYIDAMAVLAEVALAACKYK